jgi:hypothetical protein
MRQDAFGFSLMRQVVAARLVLSLCSRVGDETCMFHPIRVGVARGSLVTDGNGMPSRVRESSLTFLEGRLWRRSATDSAVSGRVGRAQYKRIIT